MRYVRSLDNAMAYVTVGSALVSEFAVQKPRRFPRTGPCRQSEYGLELDRTSIV